MTHPEHVKSLLFSDIKAMSESPGRFAKNPETDFSRKRKLDFENLLRFIVSMESGTTRHLRQHVRRILQICVHDGDIVTCGSFKSCQKHGFLSEIS